MDATQMIVVTTVFMMIVSIFVLVMIIMRSSKMSNGKVKTIEELGQRRNYDCPKCGAAMTRGFTIPARGLLWRKETDPPMGAFNVGRVLTNTVNMGFVSRELEAWRCEKCEVIYIDHSSWISRGKRRSGDFT